MGIVYAIRANQYGGGEWAALPRRHPAHHLPAACAWHLRYYLPPSVVCHCDACHLLLYSFRRTPL